MPEQNDIAKQIEERIAQLPEDIRNAVLASDFDQKIQAIGKAHNLHIDQAQQLGTETSLVMLGVLPMSDYADNIAREVRVSRTEADKIIADVNTQIFAPIRESMKRTYEEASTAQAAPANPPAMGMSNGKSVVMPSRAAAQTPVPVMPPVPPSRPVPKMPPAPDTPPMTPPGPSPIPAPPMVPPMGSKAAMPLQIGPTTQLAGMPKPSIPVAPSMHAADVVITQKTVEVQAAPAAVPPKPQSYKADPYREPIEP
ncbi:MAG TPA: hypothetical protein VG934_01935 [Candidatus Paceibacterota bacterium]|nr:hypothetical protein [Candidatus Paceibacterota bacterium]